MDNTIKLTLVGDVFLSNMDDTRGIGIGSRILKDGIEIINKDTIEKLKESDILFGNLESPLIDSDELVNMGSFAGSIKFVVILKELGFDIVSIANNHILEKGLIGFNSTKNALQNAHIKHVGVFNENKSNVEIIECKGIKFGFAAFNAIKDIPNPNIHSDLSLDNVKATIDDMNLLQLDYKLLSFHWGNEYIHIPSLEQINLAHSVIDYGADIIIGHHPHVIQPIEKYKNGIIVYSLGNFIFDSLFSKEFKTGMKVDLHFRKGEAVAFNISEVILNEDTLNSMQESQKFNAKVTSYCSRIKSQLLIKNSVSK